MAVMAEIALQKFLAPFIIKPVTPATILGIR